MIPFIVINKKDDKKILVVLNYSEKNNQYLVADEEDNMSWQTISWSEWEFSELA